MNVYTISGLGANGDIFSKLNVGDQYTICHIPWIEPLDGESISDYSQRMSVNIDISKPFILIGLSFGGLIAQEIAKYSPPSKLILFNTIQSEDEKPFWIKINKKIRLYKLFPYSLLCQTSMVDWVSRFLIFFNPDRPNLSKIYYFRSIGYAKWAFEQIVFWDRTYPLQTQVYHFHGSLDYLFPYWNIRRAIKVPNGGHLAVYEKAEFVNDFLKKII